MTSPSRTQPEGRLWVFFALTLVVSWSAWAVAGVFSDHETPLRILGTFGPAIVATLLLLRTEDGPRPTLKRFLIWKASPWVYAYALGLPLLGCLLALCLARLISGSGAILPAPMPVYIPILVFLYVLVFSVAGEELGWRGYALPRLLALYTPIQASLIVGAVWAVWHAPLFLLPDNFHADISFGLFAVQVIASSLIYTQLHLVTNGSLLFAHLFHAAFNATVGLMPILPTARNGDTTAFAIAVGLLVLIAGTISVRFARKPS